MKSKFRVLKVTALVLAVIVAMAGCDLLDDDYEIATPDDAALYSFFMQFINAFTEFVGQDPSDVESVSASMLHPFFRDPVYVEDLGWYRNRYMYWGGGAEDLRVALVEAFAMSMGLEDPATRYRVESISVGDTGYGYYGLTAYPPGKHLWVNLFVRRTLGGQRDLGVWTVGVVVEGDQFFIWFIGDIRDPGYYGE